MTQTTRDFIEEAAGEEEGCYMTVEQHYVEEIRNWKKRSRTEQMQWVCESRT